MSETQGSGLNAPVEEIRRVNGAEGPHPRAIGSPLPMGSGGPPSLAAGQGEPQRALGVPPPGRALMNQAAPPADAPLDVPSAIHRALATIRSALPFVQRILPLLDGHIATAFSNVIAPHLTERPQQQLAPPPPPVDLVPLTDGIAELQTQQHELRNQVVEQNTSLKRVEDQLEMVREATDRNTLEQQELLEDLKVVGNKVNLFALIAIGLLAVSVAINVVLYLHMVRVLP
jgi:hypothetical protein